MTTRPGFLAEEDTVWVEWLRVPVLLRRAAYKVNWGVLPKPSRIDGPSGEFQRVLKTWAEEHGLEAVRPPCQHSCPSCCSKESP